MNDQFSPEDFSCKDEAGRPVQVEVEGAEKFHPKYKLDFDKDSILRYRHAESFTQLALEAHGLDNQLARRILGGKWECTEHGWMWVKEFADNGLPREEFFRLRKKA